MARSIVGLLILMLAGSLAGAQTRVLESALVLQEGEPLVDLIVAGDGYMAVTGPCAKDGAWYVLLSGNRFGPYTRIDGRVLSPNGKRSAWWARDKKDNCALFLDGKKSAVWYMPGPILFSDDGKSLGYIAGSKTNSGYVYFVVVDGARSGPFDGYNSAMLMNYFTYSAAAKGFVYAAIEAGNTKNGYVLSVDKKKYSGLSFIGGMYDPETSIVPFKLSPASGIALSVTHIGDERWVVMGDSLFGPYRAVRGAFWKPGSDEALWFANGKNTVTSLYVNGITEEATDGLVNWRSMHDFVFSADGSKLGWISKMDTDADFVVGGDGLRGPFVAADKLEFLPDGRTVFRVKDKQSAGMFLYIGSDPALYSSGGVSHAGASSGNLAYTKGEEGTRYVVTKGGEYGPYDSIRYLAVSAEGKSAWTVKKRDESIIMLDGQPVDTVIGVEDLGFLGDGTLWYFETLDKSANAIVTGSARSASYWDISSRIGKSADGHALQYYAHPVKGVMWSMILISSGEYPGALDGRTGAYAYLKDGKVFAVAAHTAAGVAP